MTEPTNQSSNQNDELKLFLEQKIELYEEGFEAEDILQRKKTGKSLSNFLNSFEEPLVVAIDGKWGSGKTWFLQRWVGEHSKKNKDTSTVVYFDAFAHDYLSDPLPALVQALSDRTAEDTIMQKLKETAFKLVKPLARVGLAAATSGASEIGGAVINAIGQETERNLDEYWKREKGKHTAMKQFRTALESLADKEKGQKVIFVIDELDRCRPDYALEVLEVIKHFFSVPGVHFVLGVNLEALESMVRARYGGEIEANTYLQKFIQVTLNLPSEFGAIHQRSKDVSVYLDQLCNEMKIPKLIADKLKSQVKIVARAKDNTISLRHIKQIVTEVFMASGGALTRIYEQPGGKYSIMIDLIIAKIVRSKLYQKFLDATLTEQELKSYLGATDNILNGDHYGEFYDNAYRYNVWFRYNTWLFITQNKNFKSIDDHKQKEIITNLYGPHNIIQDGKIAKELPKQIESEWLDLFQFYRPLS